MKSLTAVFLIALCIGVASAESGSASAPQKPTAAKNQPPMADKPTKAPASQSLQNVVDLQPQVPQVASSESHELKKDWWLELRTDPVATFTALMFFATVLLWLATRSLVKSGEQTAKTQLRAFVFSKGFSSGTNCDGSGRVIQYIFFCPIENVGNTPATDVTCRIEHKVVPAESTEQVHFAIDDTGSKSVMGPRASGSSTYRVVPIDDMQRLWRNEVKIYIWCRLEYRDIFDPDKLHHHEQSAILNLIHEPSMPPPAGHASYVQFMTHGPQNSTG